MHEITVKLQTPNCSVKDSMMPGDVRAYADLVTRTAFKEKHYSAGLWGENRGEVEAEVWTAAIQKALEENEYVYIPPFTHPIYLDRPLVIPSNRTLDVSERTEIRLLPETNCCMMHNQKVVVSHDLYDYDADPDVNITVRGGIWSTSANGRRGGNGNDKGSLLPGGQGAMGADGVFVFSNLRGLTLRNLHFVDITPFAIHIAGARDFVVQNIRFDNAFRDGVHINGPTCGGEIRNISGRTGDDLVALNAAEFTECALGFGAIQNVLVDTVEADPGYVWSEIRLLPGRLETESGHAIDCAIENCTLQNIRGVHTIKGYDQPCPWGDRITDRQMPGRIENVTYQNIEFSYIKPQDYYAEKFAGLEFCADLKDITIRNILFDFPLRDARYGNWCLMTVGPMTEGFEHPESFCHAQEVRIENIFHTVTYGDIEQVKDPAMLIDEKAAVRDGDVIGRGTAEKIEII